MVSNLANGNPVAAGMLAVIGTLALVAIPLSARRWQLPLVMTMSGVYLWFLVLFRAGISDPAP